MWLRGSQEPEPTRASLDGCIGMKLREGSYFGEVQRQVKLPGLTLSLTTYEPFQEQPWHTHEHSTLFIHLIGDHLDHLPAGARLQPCLSTAHHPASVSHRSDVGPNGMTGINIDLEQSWLRSLDLEPGDLGREGIFEAPRGACAALSLLVRAFGRTPVDEVESLVVEIVAPLSAERANRPPAWLMGAVRHIESNFSSLGGVRALAAEVGVHPVHLSKCFPRFLDCTVTDYLQWVRLSEAGRLMLQGMSVGEAALEVGFSEQFYMSRCFRSKLGLAPSELRRLRSRLEG